MKNKHLLLIFLCTLLLGLVARYAPWFKNDVFQTDLVRVDTAAVQRIAITQPGSTELLLERSDEGWVASQDDFAIRTADSLLRPLLEAIERIRSLRIVHSNMRDTLQLLPTQAIHVEISGKHSRKETFEIGRETWEYKQPATFVEIDQHEGIYLTDKHLRSVFTKSVDDFRSKTLLDFAAQNLQSVEILRPGIDTIVFEKSDTSAQWHSNRAKPWLAPEAVAEWLKTLQNLNGLPFAPHADDIHAADNMVAGITFRFVQQDETIQLLMFDAGALFRRKTPVYVLQSTQNPFNFFALSDTLLARKIRSGPLTAPD
jgi:hypothetical protein